MNNQHCPLCNSADTRSTGLVRLPDGGVAEGRRCNRCGEDWTLDDAGEEPEIERMRRYGVPIESI
jgi:transcriptional regulator NrdR family protein